MVNWSYWKTLYTTNNDMAPSNNWKSPMPGHNPRLDPRKLRDSMKSNLSTVTFLMFTWLGKVKRTMVKLLPLNVGPWVTRVLVVTHGILQLVALLPDNVMSRILLIETNFLILIVYDTHKIRKGFCVDIWIIILPKCWGISKVWGRPKRYKTIRKRCPHFSFITVRKWFILRIRIVCTFSTCVYWFSQCLAKINKTYLDNRRIKSKEWNLNVTKYSLAIPFVSLFRDIIWPDQSCALRKYGLFKYLKTYT